MRTEQSKYDTKILYHARELNLLNDKCEKPICLICNNEFKNNTCLSNHLRHKHNISYKNYLREYKILIETDKDIEKLWKIEFKKRNKKTEEYKNNARRIRLEREKTLNDEYKKQRKEKQKGVGTKQWYIEKYGYEEGLKRFNNKSEKLSKSTYMWNITKGRKSKQNYSNISQKLFWEIYNILNLKNEKVYFGELNHEYSCGTVFNFDFVWVDRQKVIEFNGDKWHANPIKYNENDIPIKFLKRNAKQIWDIDKKKIDLLNQKGYNCFVVWESEYRKNPQKIINECVKFLME